MNQPLIHTIRELRAKVASGTMTLDEAAAELVAAQGSKATLVGARDLLSRRTADVEESYVRNQNTAATGLTKAQREMEVRDRG